jgi:hypothetical protein
LIRRAPRALLQLLQELLLLLLLLDQMRVKTRIPKWSSPHRAALARRAP